MVTGPSIEIMNPFNAALRIAGLGLLAAIAGAIIGFLHRWYARQRVPERLAALIGLGLISVWLNTGAALTQFVGGSTDIYEPGTIVVNIASLSVAALAAVGGARVGDRMVTDIAAISGAKEVEEGVSNIVRAVGGVITVRLPDEIKDIDEYDPVEEETKKHLREAELVFPRGLTVNELRERLIKRLKEDYGVGHVDIDLSEEGNVEYLAVGSRVAGLGPTLPPENVAIAVEADPPFAASPGDTVQVWHKKDGEKYERITTAELRAVFDDIVTLIVDAEDAKKLDQTTKYRLVTLSTQDQPEKEFTTILRTADETMSVVTVEPNSRIAGSSVGEINATVVAVRDESGSIESIPPRKRVLREGDAVYAVARPEDLRRLEESAKKPETGVAPNN